MNGARLRYLGLAFLAMGQAVHPYGVLNSQMQPRDTTPAPLVLSTSQHWDGVDGQWTSFILRLGTQGSQMVRVLPSTKANVIWAIDVLGCPDGFYGSLDDKSNVQDCGYSRGGIYLRNESSTWTDISVFNLLGNNELEGYGVANGQYGFDQVRLGWDGSAGANTLEHQVIAEVADPQYWLGMFPLNPRSVNMSTINNPQPTVLQTLQNSSAISSLSWGYTSGAKYRSENFYGSLVLGGYDQGRFDNSSQITVGFAADQERDLTIHVNSIVTNTSTTALLPQAADFLIDSTVPYLYLPQNSYSAFEQEFNLEWNDTFQLYSINDTAFNGLMERNANITFDLGSQSSGQTKISFPISAFIQNASFPLVHQNQSLYYFPIKRANDTDQYTLGRAFLQEAYVIADYERSQFKLAPCIWPDDPTVQPSSMPIVIRPPGTSSNNNHSLSAGAIAGAVIGGVVAGLLLAALIAYLYIRRRRHHDNAAAAASSSSSRHSSVAHTRSSSSATLTSGGRPRAGSRIASFFRNPWGSMSEAGGGDGVVPGRHELAVDPKAPTPAERALAAREREHKRHASNELEAEVNAVHEMYQPKAVVPEMQGDEPFPTYASGDGATIEGNALREAREEAERCGERGGNGVFEMDATGAAVVAAAARGGGGALPSPPMPSPGQIDAVERKEREERERLEAERAEAERLRAEELQRRVGGGNADAIEGGGGGERPDTERRVSDLSPISENDGFTGSPTSLSRPYGSSRRVSRD